MIFVDRSDAGQQLSRLLLTKINPKDKKHCIVFSLVRGGSPVGFEIARKFSCPHYPLLVKKISPPHEKELAIGAVCQEEVFLNNNLIKNLGLSARILEKQINRAKKAQKDYQNKFKIKKVNYKNKIAILTDDGVATGSSLFACAKYLKKKKVKNLILAVPVAPVEFNPKDSLLFDKAYILYKAPDFFAVGQFYKNFKQVSDKEALSFYRNNKN